MRVHIKFKPTTPFHMKDEWYNNAKNVNYDGRILTIMTVDNTYTIPLDWVEEFTIV